MVAGNPTTQAFREAASRFATGITVVTCIDAQGVDHAMTASSFASVSIDPLLVSVSVECESRFFDALQQTTQWAVSVLSADDQEAARWFASRGRPLQDQLRRWDHRRGSATNAAVGVRALAALECQTWARYPAGDHELWVGEVLTVQLAGSESSPLLYYRRGFRRLDERDAVT